MPICELDQLALEVCHQLQVWLEDRIEPPDAPVASVTITEYTTSVEIGDIPVWNSEGTAADELTFDSCLEFYRLEVTKMAEIFRE